MRKTLFSICALALSLTASAQIVDTPKGKLIDNMYRSSDSWVKKGWTGTDVVHTKVWFLKLWKAMMVAFTFTILFQDLIVSLG